jgi:hypothetical protein
VFAKVLSEEPRPLHELRASVPPNVEAAVHRALQKLPADRWPDAQTFRACLGGTGAYGSSPVVAAAGRSGRRDLFVGTLAIAALAVGVLASKSWSKAPADGGLAAESPVRWLDLVLPDSAPMAFQGRAWQELRSLDLSRDGASLVYVAEGDRGGTRLYLRKLDEPGFRPIAGTEGAYGPFFSPDGGTVGFFAEDQLRTVSIEDGSVVALGDVRNPAGAVWTDDGILVSEGGLVRFAAASGGREATAAACVDEARPCLLPDPVPGTDWVLVSSYEDIAVVSLETGERRTLLDGLFEPQARLLPDGNIAYFHRPGQLFVVPFDPETLAVTGEPVPALDGIRQGSFGSQLDVSNDGTLVYAPGGHFTDSRFTWVSRDGHETALPYEPASFGTFALSPDGRSLATTVYRTNAQVWVYDLGRAQPVPLVTEGDAQHPAWSPDGREIAYMAAADGGAAPSILAIPVSGGSAARVLIRDGGYPFSWSRGGDVSYARPGGATKSDVWVGSVATGDASAVFASAAADDAPTLSPDGRWIAYMSAVTGRWEVYVEPHPATGERWTLSEGGEFPRWSSDGTTLYYVRGGEMFEVDLTRGPAGAGAPRRLFEGPYVQTFGHAFDVAPDGQRFLMLKASDPRSSSADLTVVEGWMTEVARRLADR